MQASKPELKEEKAAPVLEVDDSKTSLNMWKNVNLIFAYVFFLYESILFIYLLTKPSDTFFLPKWLRLSVLAYLSFKEFLIAFAINLKIRKLVVVAVWMTDLSTLFFLSVPLSVSFGFPLGLDFAIKLATVFVCSTCAFVSIIQRHTLIAYFYLSEESQCQKTYNQPEITNNDIGAFVWADPANC